MYISYVQMCTYIFLYIYKIYKYILYEKIFKHTSTLTYD